MTVRVVRLAAPGRSPSATTSSTPTRKPAATPSATVVQVGALGRRAQPPGSRLAPRATSAAALRGQRAARIPAHQLGLAALGERDVDRVEVARHDRVGEDRPGLVADLAPAVARRQVHEREQPAPPPRRAALRRLLGGRVLRLLRALGLLPRERRLVHEHVGAVGDLDQLVARAGVAGDHELAAQAGRSPITCSGLTPLTTSPRCRRPKSGPGRDAEPLGELRVEAARAGRPR